MDKISIIIPVYNNEKFLEKCLESVINQTYKNIEIILVNDGSVDGSLSIMKEYEKKDSRIVIIDKQNEGVSKARNDGIKVASGKYITFVDSDDYIELEQIEEMYNAIKKYKVDAVRSNYKVSYKNSDKIDVGDLSEFVNKKLKRNEIKDLFLRKILDGSLPCFVYLIMFEKKLLENDILFREDVHMMEDVVFYIELVNKIKSLYILDMPLYNIYFNEEGATNNVKNYERNIFNVVLVNKYIKQLLVENKLDSMTNIYSLNLANINAVTDFIFKNYLAGFNSIDICKRLALDSQMMDMVDHVCMHEINLQRRIIVKCIKYKRFNSLKLYFKLRKIIFKIKRR